jgi:tetratricopeptide (TPR) repeat protein
MQSAAQAWKQRAPEESEQASLAIATAQMGQSQFDAAVAQLEPYAAGATADPQRHANLLAGYCAALANAGKAKAAAELLWPLASKADGAVWRARWVQVAVDLADATEAARWLDRVAEIVPAGALEERVVLAQAYDALADRAGDAALAQKSKACFKQVLDNPRAPVAAVMLAAGQAERTGDAAAAESLYRRAIALDAALFAAHNNLAMLVVTRGGDLAEAKSAAAAAVRLAPRTAAAYDTLAFVQAKAGDYKSAADSMRVAISLEPDNAKWRVRLAQYLLDGGQPSEAARAVAAIDDRRLDVRGLSPSLQEQLGTIRRQIRGSKPT